MSTYYNLCFEIPLREDKHTELYVLECSNRFDVGLSNGVTPAVALTDLTLVELKSIRDQLNKVISYFNEACYGKTFHSTGS